VCTSCQGAHLEWVESCGRGELYSYTIVHRPPRPEFETPYVIAIIALEEGWYMLSNLVDCALEHIEVGMAVEVTFKAMSDEITLPMFRPASSPERPARQGDQN
jgi:uncharacterized OB-fold protein